MNGGLTYAPQPANNNSDTSLENDFKTNGLKHSAVPRLSSPVEANGGVDPTNTNGGPLHIPAKRVGGHWTSPASVASLPPSDSTHSRSEKEGRF